MTVEGDTYRFRGAFTDATISNRAETIGHGLITDRSTWAVSIALAGIADLRSTAEREKENHHQCAGHSEIVCRKAEEFRYDTVLLHGVASPRKKIASSGGAMIEKAVDGLFYFGLYRWAGAMTR